MDINFLYNFIKKAAHFVRKNYNIFYNLFNTSLIVYIYFTLERKLSNLKTNLVDSLTAAFDSSFSKMFKLFSKEIKHENATLLENHFSKMEELKNFMYKQNLDLYIKTSEKTDKLILKIVNSQKISPEGLSPPINIYQESSSKPLLIVGVILVVMICVGGYYAAVPKVTTLTLNKFIQLEYVLSELIKFIPGSNTAKGEFFVDGYPHLKIVTNIVKGSPNHLVFDSISKTSVPISEFIDQLLQKGLTSNTPETIIEATNNLGHVIDISSII